MKKHALYRFYGDTGQLLYVGITSDPARRFGQHATTKTWWESVRGISIDWYTSRQDVQAAERRAIEVERPLMNLQRPTVAPPPPKKCGHCAGCCYPESGSLCETYEITDDYGEPTRDACPRCGQQDCLYLTGMGDGEMVGWMKASDFYGVKPRGRGA